ncbi:MAG: 4a-hydroxytetrahydrobiopterin dehydratase [Pseudomonadota bacterium]|nr:4a-hydroxytetrahydrobiopterin dehydratase [Pseudomonadota bacterium]
MAVKLLDASKEDVLRKLSESGWDYIKERNAIRRNYEFKDFIEAFDWMTKVALYANKINHHPEWFNVYKTVEVVLTTHDCGGISDLDVKMAEKMDILSEKKTF